MIIISLYWCSSFFIFNNTATTEIYTLSLHDALPICAQLITPEELEATLQKQSKTKLRLGEALTDLGLVTEDQILRSEEHTSELQSHHDLVCRLLLEKKNKIYQKQRT